jgi:hypothetical protein
MRFFKPLTLAISWEMSSDAPFKFATLFDAGVDGRLIANVEHGRAARSGNRKQFSETSAAVATFRFIVSLALLIALEVPRYLERASGLILS